jgi:hypothetical protein
MGSTEEILEVTSELDFKSYFQGSSTDSPKDETTKYRLDTVEDGETVDDIYSRANPARPGFTKHDQKDMYRMGKIQKFQVSCL